MQYDPGSKPSTGLWVVLLIVVLWISSVGFLSFIDITQLSPLQILPAVLGRTFIQTGLFIVAHDAIYEAVIPGDRRLNHWIRQLIITLYAMLPSRKLSLNHWQQHRHPGQTSDPDSHRIYRNIFSWYLKFMKGYLDVRQWFVLFFGIGIIFLALHLGFHVPVANLFLFWILPIALSLMQLFFFGTYLPHRSADGGATRSDNAENSHHTTSNYPFIWSFLTCYHFGYHWEHHEYPYLPWYSLPSVHQNRVL